MKEQLKQRVGSVICVSFTCIINFKYIFDNSIIEINNISIFRTSIKSRVLLNLYGYCVCNRRYHECFGTFITVTTSDKFVSLKYWTHFHKPFWVFFGFLTNGSRILRTLTCTNVYKMIHSFSRLSQFQVAITSRINTNRSVFNSIIIKLRSELWCEEPPRTFI